MEEQNKTQQEIDDGQLPLDGKMTEQPAMPEEEAVLPEQASAAEENSGGTALEQEDGAAEEAAGEVQDTEESPVLPPQQPAAKEQNAASPAGPCAKIFNALSYAGLPLLILFSLAICFWGAWNPRDLWFSDEAVNAEAFLNLKAGSWLALFMNGVPFARPPLYFWLMEALDFIPAVNEVTSMFLASALSYILFIISVWCLARATGHDRRIAFASGLIALGCLCIDGLACYVSMDLLFAASLTFAMICLYRGACKASAPLWLAAGFLLLAASTLAKGPFGIVLALSVSILFLCWTGHPSRLNSRDGIPGFLLLLVIIASWLAALYLSGNTGYLRSLIETQVIAHFVPGGPHAGPWWFYAAAIALLWMPWTLLLLFINWKKALQGIPSAWKSRRERPGSSWLWLWLACGAAILSASQAKLAVYALPLAPPLAVLCGRSLLNLSPGRSRCFFALAASVLSLLGLALIVADVFPVIREFAAGLLPQLDETAEAWLSSAEGTLFMGSFLILASILLLLFVRLSRPDGALLILATGLIAAAIPFNAITAPSLCSVLSPKAQATVMEEMLRSGYAAASYKVYPGVYAWHINTLAGIKTGEKRLAYATLKTEEDVRNWLSAHPKTVLAMPLESWNGWSDKPVNTSVIAKSQMVLRQYIVAAVNAADGSGKSPDAPQAQQAAAAGMPSGSEAAQGGNSSAEKAIDEIKNDLGAEQPPASAPSQQQ